MRAVCTALGIDELRLPDLNSLRPVRHTYHDVVRFDI